MDPWRVYNLLGNDDVDLSLEWEKKEKNDENNLVVIISKQCSSKFLCFNFSGK
jgi:hypothetical protein